MVVPRVGAALATHIAPVTSSSQQTPVKDRDEDKPLPERQNKSKLRLVPPPEEGNPSEETAAPCPAAPFEQPAQSTPVQAVAVNEGLANTFLQLFALIQSKRGTLARWFGVERYTTAARKQRKATKIRKGAMLDQKIE